MPDATNPTGSPARARALAWLRSLDRTPSSAHEALALAVHAVLLAHGFRDAALPASDVPPSAADAGAPPPRLRPDWGAGGWGGRYLHARSSLEFEVRATPLGARLRVTGAHDAAGVDAATLDLPVADHHQAAAGGAGSHWTEALRDLDATATLVLVNVAHRLVPDAAKEGYEAAAPPVGERAGGSSSGAGGAQEPTGMRAPPPARPYGGGLLEEEGRRPPYPPMPGMPGMMPAFPGMPGGEPGFGAGDLMPQFPGGGVGGGGWPGGNLMGPSDLPGMRPRAGGRGGPLGPLGPGFPARPGVGIPARGRGRGGPFPPGSMPWPRVDPLGPGGRDPDHNLEHRPGGDQDGGDPPPDMYW